MFKAVPACMRSQVKRALQAWIRFTGACHQTQSKLQQVLVRMSVRGARHQHQDLPCVCVCVRRTGLV